jgi:hypothetical protein
MKILFVQLFNVDAKKLWPGPLERRPFAETFC